MTMHADTFFTGGTGHKVCQDYARCGKLADEQTYAIVSDGCSSSPDTDFGARVLVLSAEHHLRRPADFGPFNVERVIQDAEIIVRGDSVLGSMPITCLDATLLAMRQYRDGLDVWITGDGVMVARQREGSFFLYNFDCGGAPPYLSYLLNEDRRKAWEEQFGKRTQTELRVPEMEEQPPRIDTPFKPGSPAFRMFTFPAASYDLVMLMTDGVHSFRHKETLEPIPALQVVSRLMDFKSLTGEFVTRRVRKFLTKECPELGWTHYDDLGVAAVSLGSRENGK